MSFTVTAAEYSLTAEKVAKLNKRAVKAGIPATAVLTEIARRTITEKTDLGFDRTYEVVEAEITGTESVKFNGYTLAAVLDHDVAGNVTRTVPGFPVEIPAEFRSTSASRCDHCNAVRNRTNTILVWSDTEGFKQVGSDCVKLFLGVSVSALIAWIAEARESEESEGGYWGGREYSTSEFLAAAALVTEVYGFKPSSFEGQSTKSIAWDLISLTGEARRFFLKDNPQLDRPEAKMIDRANALSAESLVWIAETPSNGSEYILNLKTAAKRDAVGRNGGLLASLPNAAKRALGQIAERVAKAAVTAPSAHVGTVGQKITVTATVVYTNRSAPYSYYSPEGLFVILAGKDGNTYHINTTVDTAIGSLLEDSTRGTEFEVTGTVKAHKTTNKGEAVTVLTRAKAQEAK